MIAGVADTHSALWYLFNDARLSAPAGDFIDRAGVEGRQIIISSISLAASRLSVETDAFAHPMCKPFGEQRAGGLRPP
jgi:PIN domain nuclease of toxin-antitoxin system